jgi:hypothetical protein
VAGRSVRINQLTTNQPVAIDLTPQIIIKTAHHKRWLIRWTTDEFAALEQAAAARDITVTDLVRISSLRQTEQFTDLVLPEAGEIPGVSDIVEGLMAGISLSKLAKEAGVARHVLIWRLKKAGYSPAEIKAQRKAGQAGGVSQGDRNEAGEASHG